MPSGLKIGASTGYVKRRHLFGFTTNAREYQSNLRIVSQELNVGVWRANKEMRKIALETAHWWSQGPVKQAELTKMDHPYAKRHHVMKQVGLKTKRPWQSVQKQGKGYAKMVGTGFPRRINLQSGDFDAGWRFSGRITLGASWFGTLTNTSDHAQYLTRFGTTFMIPRNVMGAINTDIRRKSAHLYHDVFRKALSGGGRGRAWTPAVNVVSAFRKGYATGAMVGGV